MKKTSPTATIGIMALVALILLGAYIFFILSILKMGDRAQAEAIEMKNNQTVLEVSNKKKLSDDEENFSKIRSFVLEEGQEFALIELIEERCREAGLSCSINPIGIQPSPDLPATFGFLDMTIDTEGTFKENLQFSSMLETLPYQAILSRVDLKTSGEPVFSNVSTPVSVSIATSSATSTVTVVTRGGSSREWNGIFEIRVTTRNR